MLLKSFLDSSSKACSTYGYRYLVRYSCTILKGSPEKLSKKGTLLLKSRNCKYYLLSSRSSIFILMISKIFDESFLLCYAFYVFDSPCAKLRDIIYALAFKLDKSINTSRLILSWGTSEAAAVLGREDSGSSFF